MTDYSSGDDAELFILDFTEGKMAERWNDGIEPIEKRQYIFHEE